MKILICYCAYCIVRLLLWLRYRIAIRGLTEIRKRGTRGILFLPNHPAQIDPVIMATLLYPAFRARPLAYEDQINLPVLRFLCRLIGTIPIRDVRHAGRQFKAIIEEGFSRITEALRRGENVLLYPAGRTYRSCRENLRNTRAVETLLRACPDSRIVLVRTTGLWGSSFGWASGESPNILGVLKKALWIIPANGILFSPRRRVSIEFSEPDDFPRGADRRAINRYLEAFYNARVLPNTYVPYTWWEQGGIRELPDPDIKS
jgi:long-chain-fatty-acid--[acyl-carrier-protein] ligase